MPRDEEITFADHLGRFYAQRYAFPPMVGRVLGYLLVCEPRDQSIAELSEALLASRSAITGALDVLERLHAIQRSRAAGERMDRVRTDFSSAEVPALKSVRHRPRLCLRVQTNERISSFVPQTEVNGLFDHVVLVFHRQILQSAEI